MKAVSEKEPGWVEASRAENPRLYSELDVLLRALDRFFDPQTLYPSRDIQADRNFLPELKAARDVILRILGILDAIIPESRKNAYWFHKYAEAKLFNETRRESFRQELLRQDTPERSLYLLYDSFINLKGIVTDLLKNEGIAYVGFTNIGDVISRHIRDNVFFNPFRADLNPEFDKIENPTISGIVKAIGDPDTKRAVSLTLVQLFRFLRYLGHVDIATPRYVALHSSLLVIALMRSGLEHFRAFVEKTATGLKEEALRALFQSLSYQFSMESKRVYMQELKNVFERTAPKHLRGRLENSHGILKNLIEQSVIQLAQFWRPELKGEDIFRSFLTRLEQSLRLREDIYVLWKFLEELERAKDAGRTRVFKALKSYMSYFESFTFRLLRFDDYEEFFAFFAQAGKVRSGELDEAVMERCRHFKIFLETTLEHISQRAELSGRPMDAKRTEAVMKQYLKT